MSPLRTLLPCLALALLPATADAQVVPNARYRTLVTPHFRVHYTPDLDSLARRAAASAERAWARLASELAPPRGPVDLVVADNVDYSNGFATTFPSNRIVVYATPPVEGALRHYADWMDLVVTHELVHVFHLDRSRGVWRLAQRVFGRNPALFPNAYAPSWLTEGLAVYYETRLTGSGRLAGTAHRVQALASASGGASPRLDQLSSATPAFPGGSTAYVWGSLAVQELAARGDSGGMRRFIDRSAADIIPFRLNRAARAAFGATFSDAWAAWRDSLATAAGSLRTDSAWRVVGGPAWDAAAPRWSAAGTTVAWPATFPREVPALWLADTAGRLRRLGRRTTLDVNSPRAHGGYVYGQLDYVDAFRVRADLWIVDVDGERRRLTRGARLVQPDVREDGAIVAAQFVGGTTRLVRLAERDTRIVALTSTHPDTQWSEPRWGGVDGREIAAVRRIRGGRAEIVVLDTGGIATVASASDRVEASPSWDRPGCALWGVTDRGGQPIPLKLARGGCVDMPRLAFMLPRAAPGIAGIVALDANRLRDSAAAPVPPLAAIGVGARGYRLLLRDPVAAFQGDTMPRLADSLPAARLALADTAGQGASAARSRGYSPWGMLVPRWWLPLLGETQEGTTTLGALSSGSDVVGRHLWSAQATVPLRRPEEWEGALAWRYRGLGQPTLDVALTQEWDRGGVAVRDASGGRDTLRAAQASRTVSIGATVVRPRIYSSASVSVGGEYEWLDPLRTTPRATRDQLGPLAFERIGLPGAYVSLGWSALQRAPLAVSPEDGATLAVTLRQRWQGAYDIPNGQAVVGVMRAYRSLPLPGYAKHVLAARLSGAWQSASSLDIFSAGGTSGASVEVLPGVTVGDASRTFGVRGWAPGYLRGNRALGGVLEYRAPLLLANRGLGVTPFYLARTGLTVFADAASAWCVASQQWSCGTGAGPRLWIGGVGAELWLDASASYDIPYRVRLGLAAPVRSHEDALGNSRWQSPRFYVTFGSAF